eukprot:15354069-Ditylum_brightwellii.AAC.1
MDTLILIQGRMEQRITNGVSTPEYYIMAIQKMGKKKEDISKSNLEPKKSTHKHGSHAYKPVHSQ